MNNTTIAGDEAKRTRRLLILGVLLILAAIAITAGRLIHSQMQQARLMQDRPKDLQWGTYIYSPATAGKAQSVRSQYLAKAKRLRDHWRVWAVAHQDALRQLRQAPPGDTATLMRFYAALPDTVDLNQSTGITLQDVGVTQDDINNERALRVTWQPHHSLDKDSDANSNKMLRRDFTLYHDVVLSESMSAGRSRITLWADGRITEMTRLALSHPAPGPRVEEPEKGSAPSEGADMSGAPSLGLDEGPEKEIAPPYDFLK